jgi:DNA replication protein DnaC
METTVKSPRQFLKEGASVETKCKACGKPVVCPIPSLARFGVFCDPCFDADNERIKHEAIARSQIIDASGWEKVCPACFQNTEAHKLPSPSKLQRVLEWRYGPKGLILHGITGLGKSRCLYELLKREFKAGRSISVMDHAAAFRYAEAYEAGPGTVNRWIEHRCKVDILAFDDLFKAKLTESFEQVVFTITSARTERGLPILMTTQDVGKTLLERMSPDRGPALIRRLREFCDAISFT